MIPDDKLHEIRNSLDLESTIHILLYIGYKIYPGKKIKLREDEKTPSTSIRDSLIKDFGGDFTGDVIDVLRQYHGMSFEDAVIYVATCLGIKL